jgi:hypothetical protein
MDMTIAIVVVLLLVAGYYYQYNTTCPLTGGKPVVGQPGFCQRAGTPNISPGSIGTWGPGRQAATSLTACATHCATTPGCGVFQWNSNTKQCAPASYPSAAAADAGIIPDAGYISGAKLVSRASPW